MSRSRAALIGLSLALVSIALTAAVIEGGLRVIRGGGLRAGPDPYEGLRLILAYPATHDEQLGYVPRPRIQTRINAWSRLVTIGADGLRASGAPDVPLTGEPLLAIGDSFTFGDEVADDETWPAFLERELRRPVRNGGVFGYGFDQMVLRSERILAESPAAGLIVSLIPDDVARCEFVYRYAHKPYFDLEGGALVLRNVPVPGPAMQAPGESPWRRSLRRSHLVDFVLGRLSPVGWLVRGNVRAHRDGVAVAKALVDRLADAQARAGRPLLLVGAWHPGARSELLDPVLEHAEARGVSVLRTEATLRAALDEAEPGAELYSSRHGGRGGHMSGAGNALFAGLVAEALETWSAPPLP